MLKNLLLVLLLGLSSPLVADITIRSAVAPEFPMGLHSRYLHYIAEEMHMQLDLQLMPLARRLKQVKKGQLDILVAAIKRPERDQSLIYLQPAYEQLVSSFFILKQNQKKLAEFDDLKHLTIGVTTDARYFHQFQQQQQYLLRVKVSTLKQKIQLLEKGRIDTFIHYRQSTLPKLNQMQLQHKIVLAPYQPKIGENHYFVITEKSRLFPYKQKLEAVIKKGVKTGAFKAIRQQYYSKK